MNKIRVTREQRPIGARYRIGYDWADRYLSDVATSRSENTARAYAFDLAIWLAYCRSAELDPLKAKPRDILAFVETQLLSSESTEPTSDAPRPGNGASGVSRRTLSRRLSSIRGWYQYLMLVPEETGVARNPVPIGSAFRTVSGIKARQPAFLRYDRSLPQILTVEDAERFLSQLTATRFRD